MQRQGAEVGQNHSSQSSQGFGGDADGGDEEDVDGTVDEISAGLTGEAATITKKERRNERIITCMF